MNKLKENIKLAEAASKAETEILLDKLPCGINGLEWLVLQTNVDEFKKESLAQFIYLIGDVMNKDIELIFKDAALLNEDTFYKKHNLNWWIAIDEALTYLATMKSQNYKRYFDYLNSIYEGEN